MKREALRCGTHIDDRHVLTAVHDCKSDRFDIVFGPIMIDNIYSGLENVLRARKSDLK